MLRKREDTNPLQILQAKVAELESEINSLKALIKNNKHQQFSGGGQSSGQNIGNMMGNMMMNSISNKFSEKQLADKMFKVFSNALGNRSPNSFMKFKF